MNGTFYRLWRRITYGLIVAVLVVAAMFLAGARIVTTPSVPPGLWWVHRATPQRDAYVMTCLPEAIALQGKAAGYLSDGFCPGHAAAVMKHIRAMPGDTVRVTANGLYVNGNHIPRTRQLTYDSRHRRIVPQLRFGKYRVGADTVWLVGDSRKSWDSRYYGGVSSTAILGVGIPLLVNGAVSQ